LARLCGARPGGDRAGHGTDAGQADHAEAIELAFAEGRSIILKTALFHYTADRLDQDEYGKILITDTLHIMTTRLMVRFTDNCRMDNC
jgi:hypothetical protein